VRDPLRPRSSYIEQVSTIYHHQSAALLAFRHSRAHCTGPRQERATSDLQLKLDIMTYYEYNDFLAGYILNLFPFDEAVEFIRVHLTEIKAVNVLLSVPDLSSTTL
jgi:hypothetical protein